MLKKQWRALRAGRQLHGRHVPGQIFTLLTFHDWEAYGKAMQGLAGDAEYQRRYAEASKLFELQGRALMVAEDL